MLHPSKSQSILQWFNALTTNVDVRSLSQFADGSLFCDIVTSVYSQAEIENPVPTLTLPDCSVHEETTVEIVTVDKSASIIEKEENADEENASMSTEQMDVEQKNDEPSSSKNDVEENAAKENLVEIQNKYEVIEKFIDAFYQMKSATLVSYPDCIQGKDVELAKVAVLLLSSMVQNLLSSCNEALHTITLLEAGVQEDIKECLSLLLERGDREGPVTKAELQKVLGRASKYKATPRRKTPHRGNPEPVDAPKSVKKRRGERVSAIIYEDMQDSPLKGLLQSPNNSQHKTAIALFKKETELSKLRNALHEEEMKVMDLILEKRNITAEHEKKKEECEHLKRELRKQRETTEEREGYAANEKLNFLAELEKLNIKICQQNDEIKSLKAENKKLDSTVDELEAKLKSKREVPQDPGDRDLVENVMRQMNEVQAENLSKEYELQECKKKIETLDEDIKSYKQMYEELLNRRESPMVTPTRVIESVSNIYNNDALEKLNEKEQEIAKAKKLVLNLKNQLKEKTDNLKAVLDKLASLQDKYENLLNKTKGCPTCGAESELEDPEASNSSSQFGTLWESSQRSDNAPHTRSRSTSGICTSVLVNPMTVEKLKTLLRNFSKMVIKWKMVSDQESLQQIDAQTKSNSLTVDDFAKSFERVLCILKKAMSLEPVEDGNVKKESVQVDEQEVQHLKEKIYKLKDLLEEKEIELMKTKADLEDTMPAFIKADKEKQKYKTLVEAMKKKYNHLKDHLDSEKIKMKRLTALLKEEMDKNQEPQNVVCAECPQLRTRLTEARNDIKEAKRKEGLLILFKTEMENKIKSYQRQVENLMNEKKKLELQIKHHSANLLGNSTARAYLMRKYFEMGKEEDRRKLEEEEEKKRKAQEIEENLQPVVNVNTYIINPEKTNPYNETSMSSHFGNHSIKSAYLQTEDEEDFLNHSSLAQIQNSAYHSPPEDRLRELQRRNTFCPPHLQSSYPLELHRMTPSERKYSMAPPPRSEAGPSTSGTVPKKRKVSETDTSQSISKRMVIGTSGISMKPRTPLGKGRPFKTPSSIRRLIGMQGKKNKNA